MELEEEEWILGKDWTWMTTSGAAVKIERKWAEWEGQKTLDLRMAWGWRMVKTNSIHNFPKNLLENMVKRWKNGLLNSNSNGGGEDFLLSPEVAGYNWIGLKSRGENGKIYMGQKIGRFELIGKLGIENG
jgi:hypothetical protein